ncbi:MAG: hypothetical protein F6K09_15340, partial [Merismopedia sp. SIO2A8]|nr:hypothetical protein [Merismopedia sp. SIO2A8]
MNQHAEEIYKGLVKSGAIGSLKRDILLEAAVDVDYIVHIYSRIKTFSFEATSHTVDLTFQVVKDLCTKGLCNYAMWGDGPDSIERLQIADSQLYREI